MPRTESVTNISESYDRNSQLYFDHVGSEMERVSLVRSGLRLFSELVGPDAATLDAGCGPGHISAFLADNGLSVSGIDVSSALIELAQASFPGIDFRVGQLADLPMGDGSVEAVVSRHSIIHTEPDRIDEVLSEFARVVSHRGRLFLSFFAVADDGEHGEPFDHAVCTSYQLDPSIISGLLAGQGFVEEIRMVRQPHAKERQIPHATLIARRTITA